MNPVVNPGTDYQIVSLVVEATRRAQFYGDTQVRQNTRNCAGDEPTKRPLSLKAQGSLPAVATAAAAAIATASTTGPSSALSRLGFIHRNIPTFQVSAVQGLNGRFRFGLRAHFHKAETFGPTRVSVCNDVSRFHGPMSRKKLVQISIRK